MSDEEEEFHLNQHNTTPTRVKRFMDILEQLPRLCSPTICGTLSQPTTRDERASFEWSIEQRALLSPANITEDWQNVADLDPAWRKQESEMFFSQKTIAPSPLVVASQDLRSNRILDEDVHYEGGGGGGVAGAGIRYGVHILEEEDEDEEEDDDIDIDQDDDENHGNQNDRNNNNNNQDDDDNLTEYYMDDEDEQERRNDNNQDDEDDDEFNDDFMFSPAPIRSASQKMDVFSPATFSRVMEDENTLQSTPKTTGLSKPARTRVYILDE